MIRRRTSKDVIPASDPKAEVFVTDDDKRRLKLYNCLGFVLDRLRSVQLSGEYVFDVPRFLLGLRCQPRLDGLSAMESGFALLNPEPGIWHVAKHLRAEWYESKDSDRLRFVHRLQDLARGYGGAPSFWALDESEGAQAARNEFVRKVCQISLEDADSIGDSMQELEASGPLGSDGSTGERILVRLRECSDAPKRR